MVLKTVDSAWSNWLNTNIPNVLVLHMVSSIEAQQWLDEFGAENGYKVKLVVRLAEKQIDDFLKLQTYLDARQQAIQLSSAVGVLSTGKSWKKIKNICMIEDEKEFVNYCIPPKTFVCANFRTFGASVAARSNSEVQTGWVFRVKIKSGEGLAIRDIKTSDPYCVFGFTWGEEWAQEPARTKKKLRTLSPVWTDADDNEFQWQSVGPVDNADFRIEIYDWDLSSKDDWMGEVRFELAGLKGWAGGKVCNGVAEKIPVKPRRVPQKKDKSVSGTLTFEWSWSVGK